MAIWVHSRRNFEQPGHQDVAVLSDHLRLQGLHGFAAPYLDAFRDHAHRVDDLGVAGHRFRRQVCPGAVIVGLVERDRGHALVQQRHDDQRNARSQHDEPEMRMNQEHHGEIDRRHRRIEHRQQHRTGNERAEMLQVGQCLEFAAGSTLRGLGRGAQHGSAQLSFGLDRNPHQDEAAHHVHQHMRGDRDDHDDGQHHQRVRAAAGQHAIGHVEQVDRDGEHQQVDRDRENPTVTRLRRAFARPPPSTSLNSLSLERLCIGGEPPPRPPPPPPPEEPRHRPCLLRG